MPKLTDKGRHARGSRSDVQTKEFISFYKKLRGSSISLKQMELANDLPAFLDFYHLQGIEFGRWINFNDRIAYMQVLTIAFYDLNKILGFKNNLGLDKLVFAVGARGKQKFLAHYEPSSDTINITRFHRPENGDYNADLKLLKVEQTGGISSIAHEYGHFLDYFFGKYIDQDKNNASLSNGPSIAFMPAKPNGGSMRQQMELLFNTIIWKEQPSEENKDGKLTEYYKTIQEHTNNTKDYWKRRNEIFARAFEVYIYEKLRAKKILNKGLTHDAAYYAKWPYIPRKERPAMIKQMDQLVKMFRAMLLDGEMLEYKAPAEAKPEAKKEAKTETKPEPEPKPEPTPKPEKDQYEGKVKFPIEAFYKLNADNKLELHIESKEDYKNLADDVKKDIKRGFVWGRQRGAWVSRSIGGHIPYAMGQYFIPYKGADALLGFEESEERRVNRASNKAERYRDYARNADQRGKELMADFNKYRKDWSWLTQPITNNAGGRAFAKSRKRIYDKYDSGMKEAIKADNMREYAASLDLTAKQTELKDLGYLNNRLKENKKIIKKLSEVDFSKLESQKGQMTTENLIYLDGLMNSFKRATQKYNYYEYYYNKLIEEKQEKGDYVEPKEMVKFVKKYLPIFLLEKYNIKLKRFVKGYESKRGIFYVLHTDKPLPKELQSGWASEDASQLGIDYLYKFINKNSDVNTLNPAKAKTKSLWNKKTLIDKKVTHIYYEHGLSTGYLPIQVLERGSAVLAMNYSLFDKNELVLYKISYRKITKVKYLEDNYKYKYRGKEIDISPEYKAIINP